MPALRLAGVLLSRGEDLDASQREPKSKSFWTNHSNCSYFTAAQDPEGQRRPEHHPVGKNALVSIPGAKTPNIATSHRAHETMGFRRTAADRS